jgi:hypothetical protein
MVVSPNPLSSSIDVNLETSSLVHTNCSLMFYMIEWLNILWTLIFSLMSFKVVDSTLDNPKPHHFETSKTKLVISPMFCSNILTMWNLNKMCKFCSNLFYICVSKPSLCIWSALLYLDFYYLYTSLCWWPKVQYHHHMRFKPFLCYVVNIVIIAYMFQNLHCSHGPHYIPCIDGCILQFFSIKKNVIALPHLFFCFGDLFTIYNLPKNYDLFFISHLLSHHQTS